MRYSKEYNNEVSRIAEASGLNLEVTLSDLEECHMMCCIVRRMAQRLCGSFPETLSTSAEGLMFSAEDVRDVIAGLLVDVARAVEARERVTKVVERC